MKRQDDPIILFNEWLAFAKDQPKSGYDPTAMCLSTVSKEGKPSSRMVLLKEINTEGFVFYTHSDSKKGNQMKVNPNACLCFYWALVIDGKEVNRQVRVEGNVSLISETQSDEYFHSRPRDSQIGAVASLQSQVLESRELLELRVKEVKERFGTNKEITRPNGWIGHVVKPTLIEFWQSGEFRLHDRLEYILKDSKWESHLLYP